MSAAVKELLQPTVIEQIEPRQIRDLISISQTENVVPMGSDGFWLTGDESLPPVVRAHQSYYYHPGASIRTAEILEVFGIPQEYFGELIPRVVERSYHHYDESGGIDISSPIVIGGTALGTVKLLRNSGIPIPRLNINRRKFLLIAGVSAGLLAFVAACNSFPQPTTTTDPVSEKTAWDQATAKLNSCTDVVPSTVVDPPKPIERGEYDKKNLYQKAQFLLSGGYLTEWNTNNVKEFSQAVAEETKQTVGRVFAQTMGEDENDLLNRYYVASTKEELKNICRQNIEVPTNSEELAQLEKDLQNTADGSYGFGIVGKDNRPRLLINVERFQDQGGIDLLKNGRAGLYTASITDIVAHELSHIPVRGRFTEKDKTDLVTWMKEGGINKDTEEVLDDTLTLTINYRTNGMDKKYYSYLLNARRYNNDGQTNIFDESLRAYIQKQFRQRLDEKSGVGVGTPFDTTYPTFAGSELFEYVFKKIGIDNKEVTDYLNGYRTGKGNMKNVADFIRFVTAKSKSNGYDVSESQVLSALRWVDMTAKVVYEADQKYGTGYGQAVNALEKRKLFANMVCETKDRINEGKQLIDQAFAEKPKKSSGERRWNFSQTRTIFQRKTDVLPVAA